MKFYLAYFCSQVNVTRKVLKDFTFSNGITVPTGSFIAVATHSAHLDHVRIHTLHGLSWTILMRTGYSKSMRTQIRSMALDSPRKEKKMAKA